MAPKDTRLRAVRHDRRTTNKIPSCKVAPDTATSDKASGEKQDSALRNKTTNTRVVPSSQTSKSPPSRDARPPSPPPPLNQRYKSSNASNRRIKDDTRPASTKAESQRKPGSKVTPGETGQKRRKAGRDTPSKVGHQNTARESKGAAGNKQDSCGDLRNDKRRSNHSFVASGPEFGQMLQAEPLIKKWLKIVTLKSGLCESVGFK